MKEIELKLLISPEDLPSLRRRAGARARGRGKTRTVRTIYLDTVDRRLAAGGVALRLRHEARHWTQTVKRARSLRAGLSETEETDTDAPGGRVALDRLPDALSAQIAALAGDLPLGPQFETVMSRTRWDVPEGDALVELAIDSGEVRADGRAEAFIEVEMELKRGSPSAVFTLARRLFPTGPLRLSRYNKAARGRRLADGLPAVPPAAPRHAEAVAISRKDTAEAAATAILSECVAQIASNVTAVLADDGPEGAHQLRVGLRRLRSAIRMLCGALASPSGGAALDRIEGEARWLAREVGRLRDLQVAEAELVAPAAAANPAEPGFTVLTAALRERIDAERALLGATL
ncbi:MAG: inorganic triphosphatase, partial [Pseudomonadota bacterium]